MDNDELSDDQIQELRDLASLLMDENGDQPIACDGSERVVSSSDVEP
jgi:hypothetical protein